MGHHSVVSLDELNAIVKVRDLIGISAQSEQLVVGTFLLHVTQVEFDAVLVSVMRRNRAGGSWSPVIQDWLVHFRLPPFVFYNGLHSTRVER